MAIISWAKKLHKKLQPQIGRYYLPVINNDFWPFLAAGQWLIIDPNKSINNCKYVIIWFKDGQYAIVDSNLDRNSIPSNANVHAVIGCLE